MKIEKSKFNELVDRVRYIAEHGIAGIVELRFAERQAKIEMAHAIGKEIRAFAQDNITELLQELAVKVKIGERSLWYAVKIYDTYPDLSKLPEGKRITYNRLITHYLVEKHDAPCKHQNKETLTIVRCADCRLELTKTKQ